MAKDGRKAAVGLGIAGGIAGLIYLTTRAEAKPSPPPGKANLYGKVTDFDTGQPIPGVLVTLDGFQAQTDISGNYQFLNMEPNSYIAIFEKSGYETAIF